MEAGETGEFINRITFSLYLILSLSRKGFILGNRKSEQVQYKINSLKQYIDDFRSFLKNWTKTEELR